jgi:acetyl esterase/lipase
MIMLRTGQDYMQQSFVEADVRLAYGGHESQFADLYLPMGEPPFAVVVFIHGGCWQAEYGLEPVGGLCRHLTQNNLAAYNIEYRRIGNDGGYPHTFHDIATAIGKLRDIADDYQLDLSRIVVAGHSAGGHLATWVGGCKNVPAEAEIVIHNPLPVRGVVALAPIPDLENAPDQTRCDNDSIDLMGGTPDQQPDRYLAGSPINLLPLGVPQRLIMGEQDDIVPVAHVQNYVAKAKALGDDVEMVMVEGGHFEMVNAGSSAFQIVQNNILDLLGKG